MVLPGQTKDGYEKAPFPYSGGKSRAAGMVWQALGDPCHYVEPFAGSIAALLMRPTGVDGHHRPYYSETVNDADGLLVNVWRAIQRAPDAVAEWAAWPVSEADVHARQLALMRWRDSRQLEHLMGDPEFHDVKMAGWWLWGIACKIGGGWCSGEGPWIADDDGYLTKQARPGVSRELPHLADDGRGVNHAGLREPLPAPFGWYQDWSPWAGGTLATDRLRDWMRRLADRLRWVRIVNGDWARVCTSGASRTIGIRMGSGGHVGFFVDPPYADSANRDPGLYAVDSGDVAHQAREWAIRRGGDADTRIVFAGFDGEHATDFEEAGWSCHEWYTEGYLTGGMGNTNQGDGTHQQHRERLWLSPHCLPVGGPTPVDEGTQLGFDL